MHNWYGELLVSVCKSLLLGGVILFTSRVAISVVTRQTSASKMLNRVRGQLIDRSTLQRVNLIQAIRSLQSYRAKADQVITRKTNLYNQLPTEDLAIANAAGMYKKLRRSAHELNENADFLDHVVSFAQSKFDISSSEIMLTSARRVMDDFYSLHEYLEHFVRDWSPDLNSQRSRLYRPILQTLETQFHAPVSVLVPGSGLGRLAYEIALLNHKHQVHAVECSWLMNLGAQWITSGREIYSIRPFAHSFSHQRSIENQMRQVTVCGVDPANNLHFDYGDFTTLEADNKYDAIVTLYLIDTAENVFAYLRAIARLLKPGGLWINYGPLKWGTAPKVELNLGEIKSLTETLGMSIQNSFEGTDTYLGDPRALWNASYTLQGWVARKRA